MLEAGGERGHAGKRAGDFTGVVQGLRCSESCSEILDVVVHGEQGVDIAEAFAGRMRGEGE